MRYPRGKDKDASSDAMREERRRRSPKPQRQNWKLLVIICAAVLICALAMGGIYIRATRGTIPMPNLIGKVQAEAVEAMEALGIEVMVVNAYSEEIPDGAVMLQSRAEGDMLRKEAQITITVSLGSQWYVLRDMTGWSFEDAESFLNDAGVANVNVNYAQSDLPVGTVISQDPGAGQLSRDVPVTIKISGQSVSVPSLSALTLEGARAVIEAEGLVLGIISEGESADAKSGTVIAQSIAPYTQVLAGTAVDLTICRPQEIRYAPDTALTLVVPLDQMGVRIELATPSGQSVEAFSGVLPQGTHQVSLNSTEQGLHNVYIYLNDVLFESMQLNFE